VLGPTASTGNTPPPPAWLTRAESQKAAIDSLASAIAGQQGAFSLDQTQTIGQVLKGAAALAPTATKVKAGLDAVNAVSLSAFDTIVAEAAGAVTKNAVSGTDIYTALAHIAQSGAAMTSIADALPVHVKANNAADLLAKFTGDALKTLTASETVYDIDPFSHADDAAIAAASGPAPASSKAAVEQLYVTLLGRPADPVELQNGMKQNAAALVATITGTDEYTHISQNSSVPGQIDRMYTNSFGHVGDAGGLAYWSDLVNQHKTDIAGIAQSIALGAAGSDAVTIYNRTVAATEFTTAISALGLESYYTGTNGHAFGNAWLPSVTDTTGLADAIASLPALPGPVLPATGLAQTGITDPHGWVL
jgi:hypothetical protein